MTINDVRWKKDIDIMAEKEYYMNDSDYLGWVIKFKYIHVRSGIRGGDSMMELNELDSTCGISDDELTERFKEAIRIDNEIKRIKGVPIAGYDKEKKQHI